MQALNSELRKIIHIDMDAFFASVEQRDNPALKGKPIVVGQSGSRGVVAAASYEARKFGVYSAMSSKLALQKCPKLIFVKPRFHAYKAASLVIRSIFKEYTDLIEPLSLDEAYLDVTHNKKGISIATNIALEIKKKIKYQTNLTASAGISVNKFLAKIASDIDKPDGLFVIKPHQIEEFIKKLPIENFFGVGKVTAAKMNKKGIFTGKNLKEIPKNELVKLFGKAGYYFYNVARGIDYRPVISTRKRKSLGVESTFNQDYLHPKILIKNLNNIAILLQKRLKKAGGFPKTITVKIKFSDFSQITRSKTIPTIQFNIENLKKYASSLLIEALKDSKKPIRLLGISLSNFEGEAKKNQEQLTLGF